MFHRHDLFHVTHPQAWSPSTTPTVVSILDLIPLDLTHYRRTGLKTTFFLSRAAHASVILTISHFTASRIIQHFDVDPSRIVVAPLYPAATFHLDRDGALPDKMPSRYVFSVVDLATPDPRKRSNWIAPLAGELMGAGVALLVAGAGTDRSRELGHAVGLGRVSDADLAQIARQSVCFLYFSAYEGQGLPPLEAMAAGAAVVATANTALTEIVADAGLMIDERSMDWASALREDSNAEATRKNLAEACIAISRDDSLRADLQARSLKQAGRFSEARFLDGLASSYRMAACK